MTAKKQEIERKKKDMVKNKLEDMEAAKKELLDKFQ